MSLSLLAFAVGLAWMPGTAAAQEATQAAAESGVRAYNIPSGALTPVLNRFAAEAGIFLSGDSQLTDGKTSAGLQGSYTAREALQRLLSGTGLEAVPRSGGGYTLAEQAETDDGSVVVLPAVTVEGAAHVETGTGPVEGFRAKRSVSATNVDAPLIETPATVNVITKDFIDTIGARRLEDTLQYVPGTSAQNVSGRGTAFNIRGFDIRVFSAASSIGGDAIRIDGFRSQAGRYHYDPALYERIDILKGGASLLYGTAPPGGIVQFITKKPEFEQRTRVEGTLGGYETARLTLDATGPIVEGGDVAYRLIATGLKSNQPFHGDNDDISFDDRLIINPQLTWLTPGGGALRASYEYSQHDNAEDPGIARLPDGSFTFNSEPLFGPDSFIDRENHIGVIEFTQPLSESWALELGASAGHTDGATLFDIALPDGSTRASRLTGRNEEEFETYQARAELNGDFKTGNLFRHQLTVGFSYLDAETNQDRSIVFTPDAIDILNPNFGPAPATGPLVFGAATDTDEKAIYIQDFVSIGDKLNIFGGLRYTDVETTTRFSDGQDPGSDEVLDYTFGAIYNQNALINPFISYSTALTPQTGVLTGGGALPFREGEQIELGNKSQWFDGRLATTLSLFQIEQTNIAQGDPVNPGFSILVGDQRTRGFEFEAVGKITDQVSLLGGYSYLDAEFTAGENEGNKAFSVPEHKVSLFGQYEFTGDLFGWRTGLGFIHAGERQGDIANTFELPSYERVDAFIGYQQARYDFRLSIENVLDEDYISGSDGFTTFAQGAQRFFTMTVGYEF